MADGQSHIIVTIETKSPISIGDFVSAFTSVSNQFEKFMKESYPDLSGDAQIFVNEVSKGSIIADLIPLANVFGLPSEFVPYLQAASAVSDFVSKYQDRLKIYFSPGGRAENVTNSDLKDFMGTVAAIANDPDGKSSIEAVYYEDGVKQIKAALKFNTHEAKSAIKNISSHLVENQLSAHAPYERVLMIFTQSNVKDPPKDKRSGEKVIIESISKSELPLIYASQLAEQQIKHEIRDADQNVFKRGFVVDVMIETRGDRSVAYKVTNLHQIIDLPDD